MFRKIILSLAAIASLATIALASIPANAKSGGNGGNMDNHNNGGQNMGGNYRYRHTHWQPHFKRYYAYGRYYVTPVTYTAISRPVVNTCNCLTKEYTPSGVVVFKDLCTKEMASGPVDEAPVQKQSEVQSPTNFAGKTYQDFMAAQNGQVTQKN
jgi:hypothetical protein